MNVLEPGYKVPCDKTIVRRLNDIGSKVTSKITDELSQAPSVSLCTDEWSSRAQESYLSIEAQYIDKQFNMRHFTLCSEHLEDRPNAVNIATAVNNTIERWNLVNKVQAVVHDSASTMNAACNILDVPDSVKCSAHLLQLVIKDTLAAVPLYNDTCTKGRAIVMHFRKSNIASEALSKRQIEQNLKSEKLKQSCETRWDSKYFMCDSLLRNRVAITSVLADRSTTKSDVARRLEISESDWYNMEKLIKLLRPFQVATTVLCSEKNVTISMVRPIIYNIIKKHLDFSLDDDDSARNFKRAAISSLEKRFKMEENEVYEVEVAHLAQFFDPRYKSLSVENHLMKEKILRYVQNSFLTCNSEDEAMDICSEDQGKSSALDFLFQEESTVTGWQHQYNLYLAEPELGRNLEPLEWWKNHANKYSHLTKMALQYLGVPATSATSERTFSTAGNIVTPKRNCLNPENVNLLTFLYQNRCLID